MSDIGTMIRRMRLLRGMKQSHLADLAGVSQGTVSRWEQGSIRPDADLAGKVLDLLRARMDSARDGMLRRLVEASSLRTHLICDSTYVLLCCSRPRLRAWRRMGDIPPGTSLLRFATDEIRSAEARLSDLGWYEARSPAVAAWTEANPAVELPVAAGMFLWERVQLDDGSFARLVTTTHADDIRETAPHAVLLDMETTPGHARTQA